MLYGICSDIHSNATAFHAVLDSMKENKVERRICLGDLVGYGVDANECVQLAKENMDVCLIGNHDSVAIKYNDLVSAKRADRSAMVKGMDVVKAAISSGFSLVPSDQHGITS